MHVALLNISLAIGKSHLVFDVCMDGIIENHVRFIKTRTDVSVKKAPLKSFISN